jgi:hypothetical protein
VSVAGDDGGLGKDLRVLAVQGQSDGTARRNVGKDELLANRRPLAQASKVRLASYALVLSVLVG